MLYFSFFCAGAHNRTLYNTFHVLVSANTICQLRLSWFFSLGHPFCLSFGSCGFEMWKTTKLRKELTRSCPSSLGIHTNLHKQKAHIQSATADWKFTSSFSYCFFIVLVPPTWKERVFWSLKYCVNIRMPLPHWTTVNYLYTRSETTNESPLW